MEKEQLTFSIGKKQADELRKLADDQGRSLSNMIRVLLEKVLLKG